MTRLLVAAFMAVALFVAATVADHHGDYSADHSTDFEKLDDRLDHLTARVHDLVAKIEARVDADRIKRAHSLEQRVVRLEGKQYVSRNVHNTTFSRAAITPNNYNACT